VRERPRRHSKPHVSRRDDGAPYEKLVLASGRAAGLSVADIVGAVTSSTGLDGEAVRDVLVLERFSFLSVPVAESERVIEALAGASAHGASLAAERVSVTPAAVGAFATQIGALGFEEAKRLDREEELDAQERDGD
jgi:ATP-dependent RNA helicase DeaD